jgi:dTDP-4-dehydrorhamnose 3,5-epimerase
VNFVPTPLHGAWVIEPERIADSRGFFARSFSDEEFDSRASIPASSRRTSRTTRAGARCAGCTTSGRRWRRAKLIRCTRGAIWDAIIDLRRGSATFGRHFGVRLDASNRAMLYVPEGCAHGFLTLEDDTEVAYQMSQRYSPEARRGRALERPAFGIAWPGRGLGDRRPRPRLPDFSGDP